MYRPTLEILEDRLAPAAHPALDHAWAKLLADVAAHRAPAVLAADRAQAVGVLNQFTTPAYKFVSTASPLTGTPAEQLQQFEQAYDAARKHWTIANVNLVRAERSALIAEAKQLTTPPAAPAAPHAPAKAAVRQFDVPTGPSEVDAVVNTVVLSLDQAGGFVLPARSALLGTWIPADGSNTEIFYVATNVDVAFNAGLATIAQLGGNDPAVDVPALSTWQGTGTNGCTAYGPAVLPPVIVAQYDGQGCSLVMTDVACTVQGQTATWHNPDVPLS